MTEGFVVLFPRWIGDPKTLCSRPNVYFVSGEFPYNGVYPETISKFKNTRV